MFLLVILAGISSCVVAEDVVVLARDHSARSENVVPVEGNYDGLVVCHGVSGMQQWQFDLKDAGKYYIHVYYASGQVRPLTLTINDQQQAGQFLSRNTGGFYKDQLAWETIGPFDLKKGLNTVQVNTAGLMPHLAGLVFSTNANQWNKKAFSKLFRSSQEIIAEENAAMAARMPATRASLGKKLFTDEIIFIKRFTYQSDHYYAEFINSPWHPGGNICILDLKIGETRELVPEMSTGVFRRFDLSFDAKKIVFDFKASPNDGYRIYEVNVDGTNLRQLTFPVDNEAELQKKYRLDFQPYHFGTDDMHPCYLPDGGIGFISTRNQTSTLCSGDDAFTTTNIYRMDGDGKNIKQLSFSALSEHAPVVMPDGRILYTRWEYVDKGAVSAKCLWAMRPDGSGSAEIYGANISHPPTMIYGRPIPGTANKYVVQGTPHYPMNGVGTIIKLDMNQNIRTRKPMTYITGNVDIRKEWGFHFKNSDGNWIEDRSGRMGSLYRDPYPLSEERFLVSYKPKGYVWNDSRAYRLALLTDDGKSKDFYRDAEISCFQPIPLKPRKRPPALPAMTDPSMAKKSIAACIVTDIYHGMENVKRGSVKHIRILEQVARPWSARRTWSGDEYDQQHACVTKDTHLGLKVQHGIVPVENDGSAYFIVPVSRNIFMQALDENYMVIQTERTYVNYMPGETRSCIGCHETPDNAPKPVTKTVKALKRKASNPQAQPGETNARRIIDYRVDVQPVWDKHCVECHSGDKPEGNLDLSGTMTAQFSVSYENLVPERRGTPHNRNLVGLTIGENHPKTGNVHYLPPRSMGSYSSMLIAMISKGKVPSPSGQEQRVDKWLKSHEEISLAPEELLRVTNWIDTNCQFYGSYWGRRHISHKDHSNFRPVSTFDEAVNNMAPLSEDKR